MTFGGAEPLARLKHKRREGFTKDTKFFVPFVSFAL